MGRFTIALFISFLLAVSAFAQANADAKFNQGLACQKNAGSVQSQSKAIALFLDARKMYDSPKNKSRCDAAIQVSKNIIKSLKSSNSKKTGRVKPARHTEAEATRASAQPVLELSNDFFRLECEKKTVSVTVTAKGDSWEATPVSGTDGTDFLTIQKKEDNTFDISCPKNTSTKKRVQKVEVTAGDYKKEIVVEQKGIPVILRLGENLWECSWKGGDKTIEVYCNSETTVKENNEQNWRVESKPDWVSVTFATKKKQGVFGKIGGFAKKVVKGGADVNDDPSLKQTMVNVVVEKLKSGTSEFSSGRKGEIVFASDDQRATLMVVQNGK